MVIKILINRVCDYFCNYMLTSISGFVEPQSTLYRGTRMSTSRAFLHPRIGQENLHVGVNALVSKVSCP